MIYLDFHCALLSTHAADHTPVLVARCGAVFVLRVSFTSSTRQGAETSAACARAAAAAGPPAPRFSFQPGSATCLQGPYLLAWGPAALREHAGWAPPVLSLLF